MTSQKLPIGISDFEEIIERGHYYVDKTLFIKDLLDLCNKVNLFTRPRRFGKTLTINMLMAYFEDARTADGGKIDKSSLFDGLNIMHTGEKYTEHMGAYPIISLSFKEAGFADFASSLDMMKFEIVGEFERHAYAVDALGNSAKRRLFERILNEEASQADYAKSLRILTECLSNYHGKKTIVLIDEYDVPLENAYSRGFYTEMAGFVRGLFGSLFKDNKSLEFAVITGCLRISKESIFTGLNNLDVISILNNKYGEYFGFTGDEVKAMCGHYGLPDKFETFKEWYDGYLFGKVNVYNPWSVINYMSDISYDESQIPLPYWANTSSNSIVQDLIGRSDVQGKEEIEKLINGGTITKPVHEDITYKELEDSMDSLWNSLFFTGYLRKVGEWAVDRTRYMELRIPNEEVAYIYENKISAWFGEMVKTRNLTVLHDAFINKRISTLKEEVEDILDSVISSFDEHENYYHGFFAGIMTGLKGYCVKSNRESGKGRSDLFVKPTSRKKEAFVVEFKVAKNEKDLEKMADAALKQIEDRNYKQELTDDGYKIISSYGIAFCRKECLLKVKAL